MSLRAPAPGQAAARRMIQSAFQDLERLVSPAHAREFASTTLEDVRKAAIEVERELAARQLLRNTRRLDTLFRGLQDYSEVIDTLCSSNQFLPWIWAPIRLVLKLSCDCTEAFESLIKAYAQIAEHLVRFRLLQQSFKDKPVLHPTFAAFYVDILVFHKAAYKFVTRRCWTILFSTSWGRFKQKFNNILEDLRRHGDIIDKEVNAHNIAESREMRQELQSWKEASLQRLAQDEKEQRVRHLESIASWLGIDGVDQILLQDSLADVGAENSGTVDWILRHPDMKSWLQPNSNNPFLSLQGGPGTGKSVLSASIMRFLKNTGSSVVLGHFCSYTPSSSIRYDIMVKSLFLGCVKADRDLAAHIYDEHLGDKQANIGLLEKLLETAVEVLAGGSADHKAVHIIVDGLDECPAETQRKIFRLFDRLVTKGPVCKALVSGRTAMAPLHAKLRKMASLLSLSEEKASVGAAIRKFVTAGLWRMRTKLAQMGLPDQSVPELASKIEAKADGMFLWARLILNYLDANFFYSRDEFTEAIEAIPRELCKFYEKIVSDVLSRCDPRSAVRLRAVFGWIAFAKRRLRAAEIQSALLFHEKDVAADRPVPDYVLGACGALVERRRDSTLGFIHVSVKDYLQSDDCIETVRLTRRASMWDNGLASLRCLRAAFEVFSPSAPEDIRNLQTLRGVWTFLPYTREVWFSELREMASAPVAEWDPLFWDVACTLSGALKTSRSDHSNRDPGSSIPEHEATRSFEDLWQDATVSLEAESKDQISAAETDDADCLRKPRRVQDIHANYEWVIQHLSSISHHPDINASELEHFRENLTRGAYACRFPSCDASTNKFRSIEERAAHEATHAPSFPCAEPGCLYPPSTSGMSLRKHQLEHHTPAALHNVMRGLLVKPAPLGFGKEKGSIQTSGTAGNRPAPSNPTSATGSHGADLEQPFESKLRLLAQLLVDFAQVPQTSEGIRQRELMLEQFGTLRRQAMDRMPINRPSLHDVLSGIPSNLETWGQLKAWMFENQTPYHTKERLDGRQEAQFEAALGAAQLERQRQDEMRRLPMQQQQMIQRQQMIQQQQMIQRRLPIQQQTMQQPQPMMTQLSVMQQQVMQQQQLAMLQQRRIQQQQKMHQQQAVMDRMSISEEQARNILGENLAPGTIIRWGDLRARMQEMDVDPRTWEKFDNLQSAQFQKESTEQRQQREPEERRDTLHESQFEIQQQEAEPQQQDLQALYRQAQQMEPLPIEQPLTPLTPDFEFDFSFSFPRF